MKRFLLAGLMLAAAGCASAPTTPSGPAPSAGFTDTQISGNRYRVSYEGPTNLTDSQVETRTLAHAAQLTLDKGKEWFEIKDTAKAPHKRTIEIEIGKGETLAGGASKIYDAKKTLADMKAKARTS
ncbi:MAG: hypothetical protein GC155_15300 [Alphaproteobacteria bacterium]|nr:hypothetical protein [Alphaproteobacteria bacterium]